MTPLISVGMPVYNEEKYLRESVESILNQDYCNFELIISDNASSDKTEQFCLEFAQKDHRIKYIRNKKNLGTVNNFHQVFKEATGDFFMFAGGHDLWTPDFLSVCLKTLQNSSSAVVSYASTVLIDEFSNQIKKEISFYDTRGSDIVTQFLYVLWGPMNPVYGLMRMSAMKKVRMNPQFIGGDLIILIELSFLGRFAYNPDVVWYRRMQHGEETQKQKVKRYQNTLFSKSKSFFDILPYIRIPIELIKAIFKAKISWPNKICIVFLAIVSSPIKYYIAKK